MAAADHSDVTLLGFWVSPFVFRVKVALKLKGVDDYEYVEEDIFNKGSRLVELNPIYKKVPVFIHGGKVVNESMVILEYIDEAWQQNPLLPQHPYDRAIARFWVKFAEELLVKGFMGMVSKEEAKERFVKEFTEGLEKIEGEIKGLSSLCKGEGIGYVDLALAWIAHWMPAWDEAGSMHILDDSQKFPAIAEWSSKLVNEPVIKENLPSRDKMLLYFNKVSEEFFTLFGSKK